MPVRIQYAFPPDTPPYVEGDTMTITYLDSSTLRARVVSVARLDDGRRWDLQLERVEREL
jgi:hypothetical protein